MDAESTLKRFSLFPLSPRTESFVNSSVAVSQAVQSRAGSGARHTTRGGTFTLKFRSEWRHDLCPTYGWYKAQLRHARASDSSLQFKSIEHRKSQDAPFFHEFLVLKLLDGSIYRLERIGMGSNMDAIRPTGCKACDLIEWFPPDQHHIYVLNSALVSRIEFPSCFDLLDVLAICYSIHQGAKTRVYTLQRYNCYFFCCAIVSTLARRVASWESIITTEVWDSLLHQALERVSRLTETSPEVESEQHLILRLLSALNPSLRDSVRCLIEQLRKALSSENGACDSFYEALSATLWWPDLRSSMREYLGSYIKAAATEAIARDGSCRLILDSEGHRAGKPHSITPTGAGMKLYKREHMKRSIKEMRYMRKETWDVLRKEGQMPKRAHFLASICGPCVGVVASLARTHRKEFRQWLRDIPYTLHISLAVAWGRVVGPHLMLALVTEQPFEEMDWVRLVSGSGMDQMELPALHAVLNKLGRSPNRPFELEMALEQCFLGFLPSDHDAWSERLIGPLLYEQFERGMVEILERREARVLWISGKEADQRSRPIDVMTFHQRIRAHIEEYASRIDTYQLSVARFVVSEVEAAIAGVWKSMPKEHRETSYP